MPYELPYRDEARAAFIRVFRVDPCSMKMLVWHIGVQTQFARNPGYHGKYFQRYLEPELWEHLLKTCSRCAHCPVRYRIKKGYFWRATLAKNIPEPPWYCQS